ncbi:MAG: hypothetical protein JW820_09860 [Spirochaetales bacterium]|nr:hypothetical protein [Spirochaetales bacterium]
MSSHLRIAVTCSFGLESLVSQELSELGYPEHVVGNGRVCFTAPAAALARCNLWLRTADRVLVVLAEFPAAGFDELFAGVQSVPWEEILPADARVVVTARSVRSRLTSLPACQSTVKKAVIESLRRRHAAQWFPESGPLYAVDLALRADRGLLTLDSTGEGLHRRGYRTRAGAAPLRENLAAALVMLSRWDPSRVLADPFCGSGTIVIEAAMAALQMAPGLRRSFTAEGWPHLDRRIWQEAREEARTRAAAATRGGGGEAEILASDRDVRMIALGRANARRAGVEGAISWRALPVERFRSRAPYGCLVCNPPYGERTGGASEVEELYRTLGAVFARLDRWSGFFLTSHPHFERHFGRPADRNRKLYNGNLKTYLYQYLGPLPRSEDHRHAPPGAAAGKSPGSVSGDTAGAAILKGRAETGSGRGRRLGFPTANLALDADALPPSGIYAVWVRIEGEQRWRPGAASVGYNPTFPADRRRLEVHILDYDGGELYGKRLEVLPVAYLREEKRFPDPETLVRQMERDCAHARSMLAEARPPAQPGES